MADCRCVGTYPLELGKLHESPWKDSLTGLRRTEDVEPNNNTNQKNERHNIRTHTKQGNEDRQKNETLKLNQILQQRTGNTQHNPQHYLPIVVVFGPTFSC